MKHVIAHIIAFLILICVALLGKRANSQSAWYECIKPSITPPSFVFPIVWTLLYFSIAIVLAQILMRPKLPRKSLLLTLVGVNLILNVAWSHLYFGWKQVKAAFVVTLLLLFTQLAIMFMLKGWTFWVLVPYTAWLLFASILNGISMVKESSC